MLIDLHRFYRIVTALRISFLNESPQMGRTEDQKDGNDDPWLRAKRLECENFLLTFIKYCGGNRFLSVV